MILDVYICHVISFFFKQKTAHEMRISDWSSDVCSSDLFVVEIHSIVAFRSDRKTGCRVVRTYSEKICAAAFSPRAWTYASATRTTDGISQRLRARFLRLGTARLLARCGSSIAWRCAGARS